MFRNSHNSKGSSTHNQNPASGWRIIFIALVLALIIGSTGYPVPAQAAQDNPADVYFEVMAYPQNPKKPPELCINRSMKIYVGIFKGIVKTINGEKWELPRGTVTGINVRGSMTNNIGTLTPSDPLAEIVDLRIGSADFLFTANKVGETTLVFNADVPGAWTGSAEALASGKTYPARKAEIQVKVIRCKFKVKTVLQVDVEAFKLTGISDDAVMTADEAGTFTGSTAMHWVFANYNVAPCTLSISATDSQVDLTGQLDDNGQQFVTTETIQSTMASTIMVCPDVGAMSGQPPMNVDTSPLTFRVASSGGVSTQTWALQGGSGSARIVVVPEEDEAAAFIPDNHEASWDDFSRFFGALIALY